MRRYLGGRKLQQLTKADGDALVRWMLTEARTSPRHYRADSLAGRVVALVSEHPEGIAAAELAAALPGDVHSALSASAGRRAGDPPAPGCVRTRAARDRRRCRETRSEPADRPVGPDDVRRGRAELHGSGGVAAQRDCVGGATEGRRPRRR